ncbi:hypothetical protein ACWDTQ_00535 [Streptomyces cellulosae]
MGAVSQMCKWCDRPLKQRRWRRYCNRRHAVKHRVTSWIDQLLTHGL